MRNQATVAAFFVVSTEACGVAAPGAETADSDAASPGRSASRRTQANHGNSHQRQNRFAQVTSPRLRRRTRGKFTD